MYYDGQMNDTRFNLLIVLTAMQKGAVGANYVEVRIEGYCRHLYLSTLYFFSLCMLQVQSISHGADGRVNGATVRDTDSGRSFPIRAKAIINATGVFGDAIRVMDDAAAEPLITGAAVRCCGCVVIVFVVVSRPQGLTMNLEYTSYLLPPLVLLLCSALICRACTSSCPTISRQITWA